MGTRMHGRGIIFPAPRTHNHQRTTVTPRHERGRRGNTSRPPRVNATLASIGSTHTESPLLCFLLTGWPFIGAKRRMTRATDRLNDATRVRAGV